MHGPTRQVLVAGHLWLDAPVRGLSQPRDAQHELIRDATLSAFERLIEAAIDRAVDALIFQGHILSEQPTVRACATFRDGVETLLEAGVDVVWLVQKPQERQLLEELQCLPKGLQFLTLQQPHLVLFAGDHAATGTQRTYSNRTSVSCDLLDQQQFPAKDWAWTEEQTLLRIGFTQRPIGHLASGGTLTEQADHFFQLIVSGEAERSHTTRKAGTIYHAPGCLQGISETQIGPGTATLLAIQPDGELDLHTLETSLLRREQREVTFEPGERADIWLEKVELEFLELSAELEESPAQLLQIEWCLRGPAELLRRWQSSQLAAQLNKQLPLTEQQVHVHHTVELLPLLSGQPIEGIELLNERLEDQYLQHLGEQISATPATHHARLQALHKQLQGRHKNPFPVANLQSTLNQKSIGHRSAEFGMTALQESR